MKFGITMFPTDYAIPATELARTCEDLGFDSLFFPEHTHIPSSRLSPWPGGAELPREYSHTLDPFVAMAGAAAVTKTLKVGTGICLVIERDPIVMAKEVASVDHLSNGRVIFGIGAGWNLEEMENHGTDPKTRFGLMKDRILAMKQIWMNDEATYHSKYTNFDGIWSWPKPVQRPHPPIMMGGDGPHTLKRIVEYADEWMPIAGRGGNHLASRIAELQTLAKAAGRERIPVSLFAAPPKQELIEQLAEAGVDRCVFVIPPVPTEEAISRLKRHAEAKDAYQK